MFSELCESIVHGFDVNVKNYCHVKQVILHGFDVKREELLSSYTGHNILCNVHNAAFIEKTCQNVSSK